jgi:hypothetical protein
VRERILQAIGEWSHIVQDQPIWGVVGSLAASLLLITVLSWFLSRHLSDGRMSSGPIFVVAGLIILGLCSLWTAFDAIMWATDGPYLSERIFGFLMPDSIETDNNLRAVLNLGTSDGDGEVPSRVLLPPAVSMSLGLIIATFLYMVITFIMGSTLAELAALEMKPADIVRRERKAKLKAIRKAIKAGLPPPVDAVSTAPLPNDRFGQIYKGLGHWTNPEFVETRFIRWQKVVIQTLYFLMFVSILAALGRYLPIAMWVGTAIATTALTRNLKTPKQPKEDEEEEEEEEEKKDGTSPPPASFIDHSDIFTHLSDAPEAPAVMSARAAPPTVEVAAQHLLDDVCGSLGIDTLHNHQAMAVAHYEERHSILLTTPPMTGRAALGDALVLYTVLAEAERVLYLTADADVAGRVEAQFIERAEATHWKWNVLAVNLADRAGKIDPTQSQPTLVFADPEAVHKQLCAQADRWQTFLAGLGLIVIPDIHQYTGVRAAHLAHLFRRLMRQVHHARSTAAGRGLEPLASDHDHVRFFATCDPGIGDAGRYAERIAGRPFSVVGADADDAPRPEQAGRIVSPKWGHANAEPHPALRLRDLAREHGSVVELEGYGDVLSDDETASTRTLREAEVVISRMSAARYAALPLITAHAGSFEARQAVAVLWLLATERPGLDHAHLRRGCSLVAWPKTRAVERAHLRCTLGEAEVTLDELSRLFSRDLLADELRHLRKAGHLVERERRVLDVEDGLVTTLRTATLATSEDVHANMSLTACARPWQLVERSTGDIVCDLDGPRAGSAAYPRRVLVRRGRRFSVLAPENQDQTEQRRILCEVSEEPLITAPIRHYTIAVIDRREKFRGRERPGERRKRRSMRNIGGQPFSFQYRDVSIDEEAVGVRRFGLNGAPRDETLYDEPRHYRYTTRAALIGLPEDTFGQVTGAALHALVNLFSAAVPMFVRHAEEDLEVTAGRIEVGDDKELPTIAFLDLHPEGAGFAEAITLDVVRHVVHWSLALTRRGRESCARSIMSHAVPELYGNADRAEAERILLALVGDEKDKEPK